MIFHFQLHIRGGEKEEKINTLVTIVENKAVITRSVLKLGYIFFPFVPRSMDAGDRYLADKCPSKKKKKKGKKERKVDVSIN